MHFDLNDTVALTSLATAALDIERKSALIVTTHFRLGRGGEQRSYIRKNACVGRGIAARSSAYWALVDIDHLIKVLQALYRSVLARVDFCPIQL